MAHAGKRAHVAAAAAVILLGLGLGAGALAIPGQAGYGGVGPNFLPWLVAVGLVVCGFFMLRESLTGGLRQLDEPDERAALWPGAVLVSAGLLANAALITRIGFIASCAICYALAVQGLRRAQGQPASSARVLLADAIGGILLSAPVYWIFTKFLGINLPGLTGTGWL